MPDHARQVRERGFTLFEGLVAERKAASYVDTLATEWQRLGEPTLYDPEDRVISDGLRVSPVGLCWAGVLLIIPELARVLLHPELLDLLHELLGPDLELELGAGVLSDRDRGFFLWHHHVGGIDADDHRHARPYPTFDRVERVVCTLYGSPLDDQHGVMLISPRRVGDNTAPPHRPGRDPWPGATELRAPRGSVVVFDQGTWHAVTPMRGPGQRAFFGFFVRRAGLAPTRRRDPSIVSALASDARLDAAYRAAP
ncbi:MAG TPA: hypothetical protein ENK57_20660 [Polyangiaceae bacterium]|nr:hypothetical protein [Polyangiaceae bacterium]